MAWAHDRSIDFISKMKHCPFDGGYRLVLKRTARYDGDYINETETPDFYAYNVFCTSCACEGPWQKSQHAAELFWNGVPGTERGGPLPA